MERQPREDRSELVTPTSKRCSLLESNKETREQPLVWASRDGLMDEALADSDHGASVRPHEGQKASKLVRSRNDGIPESSGAWP
jgi:hypothetical protein